MNSKVLLFIVFSIVLFTNTFCFKPSSSRFETRKNAIQINNGSIISVENGHVRVKDLSGNQKDFEASLKSSHSKKTYGGWVTSYWFVDTAGFTVFEASWVVPPTPLVSSGQSLVFLNSFEDSSQEYALQAALEYNDVVSAWSVASWFISPSLTFISSTTAVTPGQTITGVIELSGSTFYSFVFVNGVQVSSLGWTVSATLPYANVAVEAYNTYTCLQYPDSTGVTFLLNEINAFSSSFPDVYNTTCGEHASFSYPYVTLGWAI